MKDPIVDEIRKVRDAFAAQFDHDVKAMFADLRKRQKKSGRRVVSPASKRKREA
jgi:hypothetical protein